MSSVYSLFSCPALSDPRLPSCLPVLHFSALSSLCFVPPLLSLHHFMPHLFLSIWLPPPLASPLCFTSSQPFPFLYIISPSPPLSTPLLVKFFPNTWNPFLSYIPLSLRSLPFTPLYLTYLFFTSCYFSSFPLPPPCLLLPLFASLLTPSFLALLNILTSPDSAMHHFS